MYRKDLTLRTNTNFPSTSTIERLETAENLPSPTLAEIFFTVLLPETFIIIAHTLCSTEQKLFHSIVSLEREVHRRKKRILKYSSRETLKFSASVETGMMQG